MCCPEQELKRVSESADCSARVVNEGSIAPSEKRPELHHQPSDSFMCGESSVQEPCRDYSK